VPKRKQAYIADLWYIANQHRDGLWRLYSMRVVHKWRHAILGKNNVSRFVTLLLTPFPIWRHKPLTPLQSVVWPTDLYEFQTQRNFLYDLTHLQQYVQYSKSKFWYVEMIISILALSSTIHCPGFAADVTCVTSRMTSRNLSPPPPLYVTHRHNILNPLPFQHVSKNFWHVTRNYLHPRLN